MRGSVEEAEPEVSIPPGASLEYAVACHPGLTRRPAALGRFSPTRHVTLAVPDLMAPLYPETGRWSMSDTCARLSVGGAVVHPPVEKLAPPARHHPRGQLIAGENDKSRTRMYGFGAIASGLSSTRSW